MHRHPCARRPGEGLALIEAEQLEFVEDRPEAALGKYRQLLERDLSPTERVMALRNAARLHTARGETEPAILALAEASGVSGAEDEESLLALFDLSRHESAARNRLLREIEEGRYPGVLPQRRVYLYEASGGDPSRIPGLVALSRILATGNPDEVVSIFPDRAAWRVAVRLVRGEDRVRVEVEDDGSGIPDRERERLLRPEAGGARSPEGGLGLVLVRQGAEDGGGRLRAEPRAERGTIMVLEYPACRS